MQPIPGRAGEPAVFHIDFSKRSAQRKPLDRRGKETPDFKGEGPPAFALGVSSKLKGEPADNETE
jgi:hypothetical protein